MKRRLVLITGLCSAVAIGVCSWLPEQQLEEEMRGRWRERLYTAPRDAAAIFGGTPNSAMTGTSSAASTDPVRIWGDSVPLEAWIQSGTGGTGILHHRDSNIFLAVLGPVEQNGKTYLQVLGADGHATIVSPEVIRTLGYSNFHRAEPTVFRIQETKALIHNRIRSMGLTKPLAEVETSFTVENVGERPLSIARVKSSCGCTSVTPEANILIRANESQHFIAKVRTGDDRSFRHVIKLQAECSAETLNVVVFGNVQQGMRVYPESLDFGVVLSNESMNAVRVLRFDEVAGDRFEIVDVSSSEIQISHEISTISVGKGFRSYAVAITPKGVPTNVGLSRGTIMVRTTSKVRPSVAIPFRIHRSKPINFVPTTIVLSDQRRKSVIVRSLAGRLDVVVERKPAWVGVNQHRLSESVVKIDVSCEDARIDVHGYLSLLCRSDGVSVTQRIELSKR